MRVSTAFKRLLRLPGASVIDVSFGVEGVIVSVRLRRRRRVCGRCGQTGRRLEIHDRRIKRWRHLDLGSSRCIVETKLRRLRCPDCGGSRLKPQVRQVLVDGRSITELCEKTIDELYSQMEQMKLPAMAQKICDELQPNPAFFFGELIDRRERHAHLSRRAQLEVVVYFSHDFDAPLKIVPGKAI